MARYTEKIKKYNLRVAVLRGIVVFPSIPVSFDVDDTNTKKICSEAFEKNEYVYMIPVTEGSDITPFGPDGQVIPFGTVAKIKQIIKLPDGNVRIIAEGKARASSGALYGNYPLCRCDAYCKTISLKEHENMDADAFIELIFGLVGEITDISTHYAPQLSLMLTGINDPSVFCDFVASNFIENTGMKISILGEFDPVRRLALLYKLLKERVEMLKLENDIQSRTQAQIDRSQKEYFLREQQKVIQSELSKMHSPQKQEEEEDLYDDDDDEIREYMKKINALKLDKEKHEKLVKEVKKLSKLQYISAESGVVRSYLDACIDIPWNKFTKDRIDIAKAQKILDRDHNGLEKVKERIVEFLAVKQLNPDVNNQIICLVGPPGTGKTSIAKSVATATNRKYVRVSLGGIRDESDVRGHRRTYVGSMPGRIINGLIEAKSLNPVILLDEIDKMSSSMQGDPASAMLEVLDSEQNRRFRDHFIELPVDLSKCMFIATANSINGIPRPLLDRMDVIEMHSYSKAEKTAIAKDHLIPKQKKNHGLKASQLKITDGALSAIIDSYTVEAGVRNLERMIAKLCRKTSKALIEDKDLKCLIVKEENLKDFLGPELIKPEKISDEDEVGVVNGMAYTEAGGDLLKIEVAVMPGTGKLETTGSLGDVMKESAHAAVSYIRSHSEELEIDSSFYKDKDIHIHVPEGAVPKDGPSAGVTITTAVVSALTGNPVRRDVAMTGEVTLTGRVLPIGGLKEKTMAAYIAGVKTVLIPKDNEGDLEEIDKEVRENLEFVTCSSVREVLKTAIVRGNIPDSALPVSEMNNSGIKLNVPAIRSIPKKRKGEKPSSRVRR